MLDRGSACKREVEIVDVKMDYVESVRHSQHLCQHDEVWRQLIDAVGVQTERLGNDRDEFGSRLGVSTCEKCHFMAMTNEFFRYVAHDALGAVVSFRCNSLVAWRDLCNLHE